MSDEDDLLLARKALDGDPGSLLRLIRSVARTHGGSSAPPRERKPRILGHEGPSRTGRLQGIYTLRAEPIYDRILLAEEYEYRFFVAPMGMTDQNSPDGRGPKTRADTSMVVPARLPEPERFEVQAITFIPFGCDADDIDKLRRGFFRMCVGGGSYTVGSWPSAMLLDYGDPTRWEDINIPSAVRIAPLLPRSIELAESETFIIDRNENFQGELVYPRRPRFSPGASLMCVLEGFHAVGVGRY